MLDFRQFEVLSFDCYGTLIDWENGILSALQPVLAHHGRRVPDEEALALYARIEPEVQTGEFTDYKTVLRRTMTAIARHLGIDLTHEQENALAASLPAWRPFSDTVPALRELAEGYRLAILSNVDEDLFESSARQLQVPFDPVVTAESVGAYKPSLEVFEAAFRRIGVQKSRWLHVAQSRFHDIAPAKEFGLATVHVDRRSARKGTGATPVATVEADIRVEDLATLAQLVQPA